MDSSRSSYTADNLLVLNQSLILRKIGLPLFFLCLLYSQLSLGAKQASLKVIVNGTYIDVHTGPGRGYPIFHVIEKDEIITLIKSKTDWIKISLEQENGVIKEGWVHRRNMQYTMGVNGELVDLGVPDRDDYENRRWEVGFSLGEFQGIEALGIHGGFRFTKNLSLEARVGQSTGNISSSQFWSVGLLHQPFPKWKFSPYFTLATGEIKTTSNSALIQNLNRENNYLLVGLGGYYYITHRFMLRFEYNNYNILLDIDRNQNIDEWRLGLSTFF